MADQSETPTAEESDTSGKLSAGGTASFKSRDGYTYSIDLIWSANAPVSDVGSNPPGITNIALPSDTPFSGTFTNTTVGGRKLPIDQFGTVFLYGAYDKSSILCGQNPPLKWFGATLSNRKVCLVPLQIILDAPRGGGAFDLGGPVPNGEPISYGWGDLADSASSAEGPEWNTIDEAKADKIIKDLGSPLGYVEGSVYVTATSTACKFNLNDSETTTLSVLSGGNIPGC